LSHKPCERMDVLCEASVLVRRVAEPRRIGDSVKSAINRAANRLGFRFGRTRDIWYRRARRIDASEMDALRREAAKQADLYDRIARAMEQTDENFYSADIAALVQVARQLRGLPGAGTDQD
jgi:hypothetical protein